MKRILSIVVILFGAGIIVYGIYLVIINRFGGGGSGNLIFLLVGVIFLVLGIWGNISWNNKLRAMSDEDRAELKHKEPKKIFAMLIILAGVGLTLLWIINDPGFTAVFSRSAIIIGFIPIPGVLFGFVIQLIPAIAGFIAGGGMWNKQ